MVAEGDGGDCGAEFRWLQEGEDEEVAMAMVSVPGAAGDGAPGAANNGGKLLSRKRNLKVPRVSGEPTLKSLQVQVKRLEQQREFLSLLRPVLASDVPDVGAAYADVELQACDGSPVYAHKAVLAVKSKEFHEAFRANADVKVIEVSEMTPQELKVFVTFLYTGTISNNISLECMPTFFRAAEKYKVQFLAEVCEDTLVSNLSRQNAISTFDIVKKHCSSAVRESVLVKAMKMGEISTYDEYKHYTQKDPGLLLELYELLSERIGPLLAKRRRISTDIGTSEQDGVNNAFILYDGCDGKSDSDDESSEDHLRADEREMKPENEIASGAVMLLNGSSRDGGNGCSSAGGGVFWQGGQPIPPQHGRTYSAGYDRAPGPRPTYDGQMMSPAYVVPPYLSPMHMGGSLPRGGFVGAGAQGALGMMERPVGGDELMVQDTRGKKLPVEAQTKIEGRRGQNWTNCEVEALIALRGEMHEEFERNKQKQGVNTWNKLHARMLGVCKGFRKSANACKKKYSILYNEYKKDRECAKDINNDAFVAGGLPRSKKCAFFDQMDMWYQNRPRLKIDANQGEHLESPCTSADDVDLKEE
ncbi:uncharacterized protein [Physcomitrium patens]|uniref:BTB domain-containing protein n=2 Tax=Physcomitrium patens TaxID=3218 RepID=A0A2K1JIC6_PHYPA|nr:uncharacterized protein LOC112291890 [Physcomitrium patens]PNR41269.1 hypothetical protein PHYPA_018672 [Physcomitrium patens]|eukprot:XP_024395616.1 uncharacterized protein LOC112291890 [Physcomitrella patens]